MRDLRADALYVAAWSVHEQATHRAMEGDLIMMLAIFAMLALGLIAGRFGPRWLALAAFASGLALAIGLFLFEIESPDYGFRMPWLQVRGDDAEWAVPA